MTPNSNHDDEINIWCDWLTDNGQEDLANDIRFEEIMSHWHYEYRYYCGSFYRDRMRGFDVACERVGSVNSASTNAVASPAMYGNHVGISNVVRNAVGPQVFAGYDVGFQVGSNI